MSYLISKFFSKKEIESIYKAIEDGVWENGLRSLSIDPDKPNFDLSLIKKNSEIDLDLEAFYQTIRSNKEYYNYTYPLRVSHPIVSKTETGGYYNAHFDDPASGNFSTTIFLNDPDTYNGGELVLLIDGKEKMFKLKAGEGITYETGTPHRVNKVIKGDRYAFIFWTQSIIEDIEDLRMWTYYNMMTERYKNDLYYEDLISFNNSLHTHFKQKCDKILRKYVCNFP